MVLDHIMTNFSYSTHTANFVDFLVGVVVGSTVFSLCLPICCIICTGICALGGYRYLKRQKARHAASSNSVTVALQPDAHNETEKGLLLEHVEAKDS